jgi:hypothetical protein
MWTEPTLAKKSGGLHSTEARAIETANVGALFQWDRPIAWPIGNAYHAFRDHFGDGQPQCDSASLPKSPDMQ